MKKLFMLLVAGAMLASTPGVSHKSVGKKLPDSGYSFGYAAGKRYAETNPSEQQLGSAWHNALCTSAFYAANNEPGRADYWQGYADALNYYDNNTILCN
jgi:hypothetical protein